MTALSTDTVRALLARVEHLLAESEREHATSEYCLIAAAELLRNAADVLDGGRP